MDSLLGIFHSLKIDSTLWVQLGLFAVCFIFLKKIVFEPYFKAFEARQSKTVGNLGKAEMIHAQTRELESLYQRKARVVSGDVKEIYDKARLAANLEQEKALAAAKDQARDIVDKARGRINDELSRVRSDLLKEAPEIGHAISDRLLTSSTGARHGT